MVNKVKDSGLGEKFIKTGGRVINNKGLFNVVKIGGERRNLYQQLISFSWPRFLVLALLFYLSVNIIYAQVYYLIGPYCIEGIPPGTQFSRFLYCFFFSIQTFTTVGYGNLHPVGMAANIVATIEALTGLMGFALITGLLYGRFSRPSPKIRFSDEMVMHKEDDNYEMHFQMVNPRQTLIIEPKVKVLLKLADKENGTRSFYELKLRISGILFFALNWRVVHEIDESSPLFGMTEEEVKNQNMEILILLSGFEESFHQHIYVKHSYDHSQIKWNHHFIPAYDTNENGMTVMDIEKVHVNEPDIEQG